ncbi:MAG: hypothetical protein R6X02_24670 [Enhygromyxa sp.]
MRSPTPAIFVLSAVLALLGCKDKDKEPPPSGERTQEPVPETPKDAPSGPFAGFDFDAAAKRWQGAWVLPGAIGRKVAWSLEGEKLTEFDGENDKTYEFAIYSPCQVTYTDADAGVTTYKTFTFVGDELYTGLGGAGTVIGDAIVACMSGKTYVLRGEECLEWSEMFDNWKSKPAECQVTGKGPDRKFVSAHGELAFVSDTALANQQMQGNLAARHDSFAAAKTGL